MGDWQEQDWSNYNQNDWNNSGQVTTQLWTRENIKPHFVTCSSKSSSSLTMDSLVVCTVLETRPAT